jgi:hypothetical protein
MNFNWSEEISFDKNTIENQVPRKPGIYRFLQSEEYPRYRGSTRVLKIGMSETDLREEIMNHFQRHTAANRLFRIRNRIEIWVTVDFIVGSVGNAIEIERKLLREFEDEHWDLPIINSQRGYARGQDRHYKE